MFNKKGDGSSTVWIVIGVVLGLVALAMLIYFLITGVNPLSEIITPGAGSIGSIVTQCANACTLKNQYDFCSVPRAFKLDNGTRVTPSCSILATSSDYLKYGVEDCLEITCPLIPSDASSEETSSSEGETNSDSSSQSSSDSSLETSLSTERQKLLTETNKLVGKDASIYSNCFQAVSKIYSNAEVISTCVYSDPPGVMYIFKNSHNKQEEKITTAYQPDNLWQKLANSIGLYSDFWVYSNCKTVPKPVSSSSSKIKLDNLKPGDLISYIWSKSEGGHNAIFINWTGKKEDRIANLFDWNGKGSDGKKVFRYYQENLSDNSNGVYVYWSPVEKA